MITVSLIYDTNSILRLGWDHPANMLGEEQWNWLEAELELSHKHAQPIVIISSIQVGLADIQYIISEIHRL